MKIHKSLIEIHAAVFLFGLAGLFGKWLPISPFVIVFGRVFFASIALAVILIVTKQPIRIEQKNSLIFPLLGFLLAFHWICFFRSIQISNVAVGLLSYSSFPLFTALLEPLFLKTRLEADKIIFSVFCLGGILLIIPRISIEEPIFQGVVWGIMAGMSFSILSILNKKLTRTYSSKVLSFYLNSTASIFLLPFLFFIPFSLDSNTLLLLAVLGVLCTAVSHTLFINSMKNLSARTASLISTLEPVYGIIMALIFLKEIPSWRTVFGGLIIIGTAAAVSMRSSDHLEKKPGPKGES